MKWFLLVAALAVAAAGGLAWWASRPVTLTVNGQPREVKGFALHVGDALINAGLALHAEDEIDPPVGALLPGERAVRLTQAAQARIVADGHQHQLVSAARTPAVLLAQAGVMLKDGDILLLDGAPVDPKAELDFRPAYAFQVRRALAVTVTEGGQAKVLRTTAATLGEALWQAGMRLTPDDALTPGWETPLTGNLAVEVRRATPLTIHVDGADIRAYASAQTVGEGLAQAGVALQGLDYSVPAEDEPLPEDGRIRVVRVGETVLLEEEEIPFEVSYAPDPNTELDQRSVVDPGQTGLIVKRVRVRYEDGVEVARASEGQWQAREPRNQVIGYGTQVVIRTMQTSSGTIEYWRAVTMYATSFSPCNLAADHCGTITASGLPLKKGIMGVKKAWYNIMAGQQAYVEGYGVGVIADYGAGVPGKYHIDLGFEDSDYEPWHRNVTVYFLTPVPAYIPYILP